MVSDILLYMNTPTMCFKDSGQKLHRLPNECLALKYDIFVFQKCKKRHIAVKVVSKQQHH